MDKPILDDYELAIREKYGCIEPTIKCVRNSIDRHSCLFFEFYKEYKRPKKIEQTIELAWHEAVWFVEREIKKTIRDELGMDIAVIMSGIERWNDRDHIVIDFLVEGEDLSGTAIAEYHSKKFKRFIEWVNPETDRIERIKWEHEAFYIESICLFIEV